MYKIYLGDQVIYDTTDKDTYPISDPVLKLPLKDSGTLEFKVFPDHPQFADLKIPFKIVTVTRDDEEIFFGRTLRYSGTMGDAVTITCEGALSFLNDADMAKLDSTSETVSAFFTRCITAYNASVESAKQFVIGNVTVDKASSTKKFSISRYQKVNDVISSQLTNRFGGFLRVRPNPNGNHFIDYVSRDDFTTTYNTKLIKIGQNIISKEDKASGEKVFTILRPIGEKDVDITSLTQSDVTIPNCTKSGNTLILTDLTTLYGTNITETMSFTATTASALLTEAEAYITKVRSHLPSGVEVNYVDFHYLNPEIDYVDVGNAFSNIEGFTGQIMIVTELDLNLEDATKDTIQMENSESIEQGSSQNGGTGSASGSGSFSGYAGQQWKYYHEVENEVTIATDKINILAEEELNLAGKVTSITASDKLMIMVQNSGTGTNTLQLGYLDTHDPNPSNWVTSAIDSALFTYDSTSGRYYSNDGRQVEEVVGSDIWMGRDHITQVAGKYLVVGDPTRPGYDLLQLVEGTEFQIKDSGAYSTVASTKALNKKARVYRQFNDPVNNNPTPKLFNGDIWIKDSSVRTWADAVAKTWGDSSDINWRDYFGSQVYIRTGEGDDGGIAGSWVLQNDAASVVENNTYIEQLEDRVTIYASRNDLVSQKMDARITVEAGKITQIVQNIGADGTVTAASVILSINDDQSQYVVNANKIDLNGYVKATDITTDYLTTKIAAASTVTVKNLTVDHNGAVRFVLSGAGATYALSETNVGHLVTELQIVLDSSTNVYTLQKKTVAIPNSWTDVDSFSRATSLSGAWSGGNYVVTATPQGNTLSYNPPMRLNGSAQNSNFSAEITETTGGSTVARKSIYGYLIYNQASSYVDVNTESDGSGTTVARISVGGSSHNISITPNATGSSTDPGNDYVELWSTTNFVRNFWYTMTVNCGNATKKYKIHITQ